MAASVIPSYPSLEMRPRLGQGALTVLPMPFTPLNRRRWLQGALATGSALAMPQIWMPRASGQGGANDKIEIAVIGCGKRGLEHVASLLKREDVRVTALADVDERHLREAKVLVDEAYQNNEVKAYQDFRELIATGGADAAVIAVPNHWHALIAIACAEAGLDLYGETPIAHSIVEGRAICRAVNRCGRVWQTGNTYRSKPLYQRACGLVASGRLGVSRTVEIGTYGGMVDLTGNAKGTFFQDATGLNYDFWLGPAAWLPYHPGRVHENWRWHASFGGGQLHSWMGQYIDVALWALGLDGGGPLKVEATGEFANHPIYNVPVRYAIDAFFANDLKMRVSSSLAPGIRWHGDDGWIYVGEGQLLASSPDLLRNDPEDDWAMARFNQRGQDHWQDFIDAIRTRRPTLAPCETAQRAASIGHLGTLALTSGRALSWRPRSEMIVENPQAAELLEIPYRAPWTLHD